MELLKLMTFNVQLPSLIMAVGQGQDDRAKERADAIADAILNLPLRDRPDVMAFNEVFNEDARDKLISRLGGAGMHVVKKIDDGGVGEDSGLMLISRHPFLPLPKGGTSASHTFKNSASPDSGARKSVALVRIAVPDSPTTIVFTHLQASYDADNSEHRDVRETQLNEIMGFLKDTLGPSAPDWKNVVLVGDLNIKGDLNSTTDEWDHVFVSGQVELGKVLQDGWREYMHPPGGKDERDPGFTQRELGSATLNRVDYHSLSKLPPAGRRIVPHHMFTPLREQSDHWSLLSRVQRFTQFCTPATAFDLLATVPLLTGAPAGQVQSEARQADLNIQDPGACQWIFVREPGTYSLFTTANAETAAFSVDDLTHPLARLDQISMKDLPPELQAVALERRVGLVPKGETIVSRTPFFIRARGRTDALTGPVTVWVIKHRGDSASTAIVLPPNVLIDPGLPKGQTLGTDDRCWFRADIPAKFDGGSYAATFVVRNPTQVPATLSTLDPAFAAVVPAVASADPELKAVVTTAGQQVFLTLKRNSINDVTFTIEWQSPLSFLLLDEAVVLHVDDETGPDWPGADSLELTVSVDNEQLLFDSWDDADTDEDWPGLAKLARGNAASKAGVTVRDAAFVDAITVSVVKTDGISAHGSVVALVSGLTEYDQPTEVRKASLTVPDPVSNGQLSFSCTMSRFPSGQ